MCSSNVKSPTLYSINGQGKKWRKLDQLQTNNFFVCLKPKTTNCMSKKMCKNSAEIKSDGTYNFECAKCGQKAKKEKHLCRAKPLNKEKSP